MVVRFNINVDQNIQMDGTIKVVWYPSREGEWVRYTDYADRIAELEERLKFNQENHDALVARWEPHIADMEAKLDAVQPLPDKWRKYTFDNPEATSYIDSADCADELEEALGEAK